MSTGERGEPLVPVMHCWEEKLPDGTPVWIFQCPHCNCEHMHGPDRDIALRDAVPTLPFLSEGMYLRTKPPRLRRTRAAGYPDTHLACANHRAAREMSSGLKPGGALRKAGFLKPRLFRTGPPSDFETRQINSPKSSLN